MNILFDRSLINILPYSKDSLPVGKSIIARPSTEPLPSFLQEGEYKTPLFHANYPWYIKDKVYLIYNAPLFLDED